MHAVAWHWLCPDCAREAADQLELHAGFGDIRIYRCTVCGTMRSCADGYTTCCQVCVNTPGLRARDRTRFERENEALLRARLDQRAWPGWEVLACDVYGLPFNTDQAKPRSHGTWARHDACGTVQLVGTGRPECSSCPPEPGSRTYRARASEPALLYLVRYGDWQKYGIGTRQRLQAHLAGGAAPVQVLTARHSDVTAAEKALKRQLAGVAVGAVTGLPTSFEAGTEVVPTTVPIDLHQVLPSGRAVRLG